MASMEEKIKRINELYHKSKTGELTVEEKEEQAKLRRDYLDNVRGNLRAQMNQIDIIDENGKITNLGEKYGKNGDR